MNKMSRLSFYYSFKKLTSYAENNGAQTLKEYQDQEFKWTLLLNLKSLIFFLEKKYLLIKKSDTRTKKIGKINKDCGDNCGIDKRT